MGTHTFFYSSDGDVLTGVSGLYKTGFTLGVVGICYSAYSLVKVRIHTWQCALHLTENIAHTIGKTLSGVVVALVCPMNNKCMIIF
jgi:hypothetical protein